jgi:uncharacterized protein (DUF1697 family)
VPGGANHVAFLRGINVGGRNRLPMKDLAALFTAAGCGDVRTYIQSGNVVFTAAAALAKKLPAAIEAAIRKRAGIQVPLVIRSPDELRAVAGGNPLLKAGAPPEMLHVGFLVDAPTAAQVAVLDPKRSPPDEFVVRGREVYFRFPNGLGRSKLTSAYFDSKLGTTITVRNWRTVQALLELCG